MFNDVIYKDYTINNLLFNEPCIFNNLKIYPILVKDWIRFQDFVPYLMKSKEHYQIEEKDSLINAIIESVMLFYNNNEQVKDEQLRYGLLQLILSEMCEMFTMIFKKDNIRCKYSSTDGICFISNEDGIIVSEENFDEIRRIVLKQNMLFEPIIYKSKFKQMWAEKVRRGKAKTNDSLELYEIENIVRCELKIPYQEIKEMNIFQLFVDFARIMNTKEVDTINLLKTTYGLDWKNLPNSSYGDKVVEKLMRNPELDYFKDFSESNFSGI